MRKLRLRWQALADGREEWERLVRSCPEATIFHRRPWLESLQRAYGFELQLISLVDEISGQASAAAVFARARGFRNRRLISLPFSDSGAVLALDPELLADFTSALCEPPFNAHELELHGYSAAPPWQVERTFVEWRLDLAKSAAELHRGMAANFRRQLRRGEEVPFAIRRGHSLAEIRAFYELMLLTRTRFGLPVQPFSFFQILAALYGDDCEVWLLSQDGVDRASMFLLRDGDTLHFKWSARAEPLPPGANHVLIWRMLETHAGHFKTLNLGRNDARNAGMSRFKGELGAGATPLPYSFFPRSPATVSAEQLVGTRAVLARVWRRMPLPVARRLGPQLYKYLV